MLAKKKTVKKVTAKKSAKKVINSLSELLEDIGVIGLKYGEFLTTVVKRVGEEKDDFKKMIKDKKKVLEETPLTRKQFDEEIKKVDSISNSFNTEEFDTRSEKFHLSVLEYFVSSKVADPAKAKKISSFIWDLDFYSLLFYFKNYEYEYGQEYDEEQLPNSSRHIYDNMFHNNNYVYQGHLVDKIIDAMK